MRLAKECAWLYNRGKAMVYGPPARFARDFEGMGTQRRSRAAKRPYDPRGLREERPAGLQLPPDFVLRKSKPRRSLLPGVGL